MEENDSEHRTHRLFRQVPSRTHLRGTAFSPVRVRDAEIHDEHSVRAYPACFTFRQAHFYFMKITVDLPEKDLSDIMRFSGEKKKGPAIVKFLATELMLRRRRELSQEVMSGKVRLEFPNYETVSELDRRNPWDK